MRLWRICRARHAKTEFAGDGAKLFGGRWNSRGTAVVYTSTSLALAAIETFVNLEPYLRPNDLVSIEAELPDDESAARLEPTTLPRNWRSIGSDGLRPIGDEWVRSGKTPSLYVPSAALRTEWNVLLNPAHAHFRRLRIEASQRFEFDVRMFH